MSEKRYFEFVEGTSAKFWEVWIDGTRVMTRYGKIGASGQTTIKDEGDGEKAQRLYDKLVREKTGKGYVEGGAKAAPADDGDGEEEVEAPPAPAPVSAPVAKPVGAGFRRFEFSEDGSNKFWEVRVTGSSQTVRYGRIGTDGQSKVKSFVDHDTALRESEKLIEEKVAKGYVEVSGGGAPAPVEAAAEAVEAPPPPAPAKKRTNTRRFTFSDDSGGKFWDITVEGATVTVLYGAVGSPGTGRTREFADASAAKADADSLIAEKVRKGYLELN